MQDAWRADYNTDRTRGSFALLTGSPSQTAAITAEEGITDCQTPIAAG